MQNMIILVRLLHII